jgi:hypothetical protein
LNSAAAQSRQLGARKKKKRDKHEVLTRTHTNKQANHSGLFGDGQNVVQQRLLKGAQYQTREIEKLSKDTSKNTQKKEFRNTI